MSEQSGELEFAAQVDETAARILQNGGAGRIGLLCWAGWGILAWIVLYFLLNPTDFFGDQFFANFVRSVIATGLLFRVTSSLSSARISSQRTRAALLMADLDSAQLPVLVALLEHRLPAVRHVARLRLTTVLPTVSEEQMDSLTEEQRTLLYDQLTPAMARREPDFVMSLLSLMASTGGEDALAAVDHFSRGRMWSPRSRRVRGTALGLLPSLEKRVAELRLRPRSHAPASNEEDEARAAGRAEAAEDEHGGKHMRFPFLVALYGIVLPFFIGCTFATIYYFNLPLLILSAAATVLTALAPRITLMPKHQRLARELAEIDDVKQVGMVVDALALPDPTILAVLRPALIRLLGRIRASDSALLDPGQRRLLYGLLKMDHARAHADLQVAVLKALEQIADPGAIPAVQSLANAHVQTARQRRVKEAAQACVSALQEHAGQVDQSWTLLRPASAPGDAVDVLLRPASATVTPAELLLRPVEGESSGQ